MNFGHFSIVLKLVSPYLRVLLPHVHQPAHCCELVSHALGTVELGLGVLRTIDRVQVTQADVSQRTAALGLTVGRKGGTGDRAEAVVFRRQGRVVGAGEAAFDLRLECV